MKNKYLFTSILMAAFALYYGCNNPQTNDANQDITVPTEQEGIVYLTKDQERNAGIVLGSLTKRKMVSWIEATGTVVLPPQGIASVFPRHAMYISSVSVQPGQSVNQGQVLAYGEHPGILDLQRDYLQFKLRLQFLDSLIAREQKLVAAQAIPEKQLLMSQHEHKDTQYQLRTLGQKLAMIGIATTDIENGNISNKIALRSNLSGIINKVNVHPGTFVNAEFQCFEILRTSGQQLELTLFTNQMGAIQKAQRIIFEMSTDTTKYTAKVLSVRPSADASSTTTSVLASIDPGQGALVPGTRIKAKVATGEKQAYAIKSSEIVQVGNAHRLFIKTDSTYKAVWVIIGQSDAQWTELAGPPDIFESRVVLKGNYYLQGAL